MNMNKTDIIQTLNEGERVTSIYAETYLNDDYCDFKKPITDNAEIKKPLPTGDQASESDKWVSPSDLLIGILELNPPFTSKITRGKTHQGILNIGNGILDRERARFLKLMSNVLKENDAAWNYILEHEKAAVAKKVKAIYQDILTTKNKTLMKEINIFYESSLQELEDHLRSEVQTVLISAHANIISDLNTEIKENLEKERVIVENVLQKKYNSEIKKITHYYKLLLDNEIYRNNKLVNQAIRERNDALKAFYTQIEAQNITSTMYMMCMERKKCKIKKFILQNIQSTEIAEKLQKIKEQQEIIDAFKEREKQISEINEEWEEKIKKIIQLFLKFVSFSLKLLPEQTSFLLDLEEMVVLQLNEIQKAPLKTTPILIDRDVHNILKFEEPIPEETVCDKEPFVVEGDLSDPVPPMYGSKETLASDVDLPYMTLQRKFIYAKCGRMEEVKAFFEAQRCKCMDKPPETPSPIISIESVVITETKTPPTPDKSESSYEPLLMDDIQILQDCPIRRCKDWAKSYSFPNMISYLDFTEQKYETVKGILGKPPKKDIGPDLIDPELMTNQELPFAKTKELFHHVQTQTQYSSQEDITDTDFTCTCMGELEKPITNKTETKLKRSESQEMNEIITKRQHSLQRVLYDNPKLLKMFTDEGFDFTYTIK